MSAATTSPRRAVALAALAFALPLVAWALSNPLFAAPDETAHMVRAQSFARLDFSPPFTTDGLPIEQVECYRFLSDTTAECMDLTWLADGTQVDVPTDGYPPLVHIIAAIPATVTSGLVGAYAVRVWLAAVVAGLFGWAFTIALRAGPWRATGLLLGVTPGVAFISSSVNPSGITAAGSALIAVSVLDRRDRGRTTRGNAASLSVGCLILIGSRRDGVVWLAVIALLSALLIGWGNRSSLAAMMNSRTAKARRIAASIVAAVVVTGGVRAVPWVWRFVENSGNADRSTWQAMRSLRVYFDQLLGVFGWLDSTMGIEPMLLSVGVLATLMFGALSSGRSRERRALLLGLVLLAAVPVAFGTLRYPYFQGRYLIPLWIMVTTLAGSIVDRSKQPPARPGVLLGVWGIVHLWSVINNSKRYAVGRNGSWELMLKGGGWHPPMMSNLIVFAMFAVVAVLVHHISRRITRGVGHEH